MDNGWAFSDMNPQAKNKTIRAHVRVGGNCDIKQDLDKIAIDLQADERVTLRMKGLQLMKTVSDYALLGLPRNISLCTVKDLTDYIINKVGDSEPKLVKEQIIYYNVHKGYPSGMTYTPFVEGKPRVDNGRKCFISQVDYNEPQKIGSILDITKNDSLWTKFRGDRAFTLKLVPTYRKYEDPELGAPRSIYQNTVRDTRAFSSADVILYFQGCLTTAGNLWYGVVMCMGIQKSWLQS